MEKIALITGASKGIGKAFAHIFAKNGYRLLLVARNTIELEELQQEVKNKYRCDAKILSVDLARSDGVDRILNAFKDEISQLDVLVNNAGFGIAKKFHEMPAEEMEAMLMVNMVTPTKLAYRILPFMLARKQGKILNISSTASWGPGPYMAEYYATKAYISSWSEALRQEYQKDGVTISTLCPGFTKTDFARRAGTEKTLLPSMTPNTTAEQVAEAGYSGLMRGKGIIVPGVMNNVFRLVMWLTPAVIIGKFTGMLGKPKT